SISSPSFNLLILLLIVILICVTASPVFSPSFNPQRKPQKKTNGADGADGGFVVSSKVWFRVLMIDATVSAFLERTRLACSVRRPRRTHGRLTAANSCLGFQDARSAGKKPSRAQQIPPGKPTIDSHCINATISRMKQDSGGPPRRDKSSQALGRWNQMPEAF